MARKGLLKRFQPRDRELAQAYQNVNDAVETLAADHDVIAAPATTLIASGPIPAGPSFVSYTGGPSQTLTLPPANAQGASTCAVIVFLNLASVAVSLVPSRGDSLNGTTSLSAGAGVLKILASDGVSKWLSL